MSAIVYIFNYLVFPGLLFTAVLGLLTTWIDRKLTARLQYRVGPPWYQPFVDVLKLAGKEVVIPAPSRGTGFIFAPLLGLAGASLAAFIIGMVNLKPGISFVGDLVVVIYLLNIPSLALILGAGASGNPYSAVGASREMKLILAYELPFILVVVAVALKVGGFSFSTILAAQKADGPLLYSLSGVLSFVLLILVFQAKLSFVPFDIPEAETEIIGGVELEYSGVLLAVIKLVRAMMLAVVPIFLITMFWGGLDFRGWGLLWGVLKYLFIVLLFVLIKNTNPRVKISQAVRFFWGPLALLGVLVLVLSWVGL